MKKSFVNSVGVLVYVTIVASIMNNGDRLFGKTDTIYTGIAVLMLFTLSALVVGGLVLGKPVMLYLDGKKKEAVSLLMATAGWLAIFTVVFFIIMAVINLT